MCNDCCDLVWYEDSCDKLSNSGDVAGVDVVDIGFIAGRKKHCCAKDNSPNEDWSEDKRYSRYHARNRSPVKD